MLVRMGLLNKKPDWSTERFRAYWREEHARLASQLPGLRAYHQNHVVDSAQRGISFLRGPEQVDGFSQLWFDDAPAMGSALATGLGPRLVEDENHFIGHLRIVTVDPHVVVEPPRACTDCIKRMSFLRCLPGVSAERFAHEWRAVHGPLVRGLPGLLGYRQNLVTHRESPKGAVVGYEGLPIDGIVELWFRDKDALDAAFASPRGVETMQHATTFIGEITTFLVEPFVVV